MNMTTLIQAFLLCLLIAVTGRAEVREWSDATGTHRFKGDLMAAGDKTVVLRRPNGDLEAYSVEELSEADRSFVQEHLSGEHDGLAPEKMQIWTSRDGLRFRGKVIGYGSNVVRLKYERGAIQVNGRPIQGLDQVYQMTIPKVVAEFDDQRVTSTDELTLWGRRLHGKEKSFDVAGVEMQLDNREKVTVPLFLFSDDEREILEDGWESWKTETAQEEDRQRDSFLARAAAEEYQRNRESEERIDRRIRVMQLQLLAVRSGIANLWEVQMLPRPGVRARQVSVVVTAKTSAEATAMAASGYPAFVPGLVRQLNY